MLYNNGFKLYNVKEGVLQVLPADTLKSIFISREEESEKNILHIFYTSKYSIKLIYD
jgi:hypothetical protein